MRKFHPAAIDADCNTHCTLTEMASRSPSPPPQPPVAATPGPRATALQKVFTQALSSAIKANSYANFSACFPTPAMYCPTALEAVWKQINTRLEEGCTREFEAILRERNVIEGLNHWDQLVEDARRRMNRGVLGEQPSRPYVVWVPIGAPPLTILDYTLFLPTNYTWPT